MKNYLILIYLFAGLFNLSAKNHNLNSGIISGKIIDKKTGIALSYVSVSIKDGSTNVASTTTDENGVFTLTKLPFKELKIEVFYVGYEKYIETISLSNVNNNIQNKVIYLVETVNQLAEVSIVREKSTIEQKADKKVITVGKDLISAGPSAIDVLNLVPSVSVDPQNNSVSLRGNENVKIWINGRPTNLTAAQVLQQIPSSNIKQIELITNPSAKYNPEGKTGIINIILHKSTIQGINGSLTTGVNFAKTPKGNGTFDLNYGLNKWNFNTSTGYYTGRYFNRGEFENDFTLNGNSLNNNISYSESKYYNKYFYGKYGLDYFLNEQNTISFYTIQSFSRSNSISENMVDFKSDLKSDIFQKNNNYEKAKYTTYDLLYQYKFKNPEKKIDFETNYSRDTEPENRYFYDQNDVETSNNFYDSEGDYLTSNLDFTNPMEKKKKIEAGLEYKYESRKNKFETNGLLSSDFLYKRNIYSAYTNFSKSWDKWSFQAGLRLEGFTLDAYFNQPNIASQVYTDKQFNYYPSAFVTYSPNEKNTFTIDYSRRIDRPGIYQISPVPQWSTPTLTRIGNPDLRPEFTNAFELKYDRTFKMGNISTSTFFNHTVDGISEVILQDAVNPINRIYTYQNVASNYSYGVEISSNLSLYKWWNVTASADSYTSLLKGLVQDLDGNFINKEVTRVQTNARINQTFKLNKDFRVILFTMYRGQSQDIQIFSKDRFRMDLSTRLDLLKGKGSLTVRFNDIFSTFYARFSQELPNYSQGSYKWESQSININFSYRFGSDKAKTLERKERGGGSKGGNSGGIGM